MVTNIHANEQDLKDYQDLKGNRICKYIILKIEGDSNLAVEYKSGKDEGIEDLKTRLPVDDARYVIYDFDFETDENPPRKTSKIILILWVPQGCGPKKRFTYAGTKTALKSDFQGIQKDFQISDLSEICEVHIRKELLRC